MRLKKVGCENGMEFIWLGMGPSGGILWTWKWISGFQ